MQCIKMRIKPWKSVVQGVRNEVSYGFLATIQNVYNKKLSMYDINSDNAWLLWEILEHIENFIYD